MAIWHVSLSIGADAMGKNVGGGTNGELILWWWETESGSGHHEEEQTVKLIANGEKRVVLCEDYRKETFIRPSKETRQEYYEIDAEELARLIKKHGKSIPGMPPPPTKQT